jgi:hypothetical protein
MRSMAILPTIILRMDTSIGPSLAMAGSVIARSVAPP